jgi:hypothetical protein
MDGPVEPEHRRPRERGPATIGAMLRRPATAPRRPRPGSGPSARSRLAGAAVLVGALAGWSGCGSRDDPAEVARGRPGAAILDAPAPRSAGSEILVRDLELQGFDGTPTRAVLAFPRTALDSRAVRATVALHGRGESIRGPASGARGWVDDYALLDAFAALAHRRLTSEDYRGFVDEARLAAANAILARSAPPPLVVVAPYLPDLARERPGSPALRSYGDWLAGPLLEAARREVPSISPRPEDLGVDGVSLGGMVALEAGFAHPETFGRVGGIQPAITGRVDALVPAAVAASRSGPQALRLLTSRGDPFLGATRDLAEALGREGLRAELLVLPGPHDYAWNRGPGSLELLLFHACR